MPQGKQPRRKPTKGKAVPSLGAISPPARSGGNPYDSVVLGETKRSSKRPPNLSKAVQNEEERNRSDDIDQAITLARAGDDTLLLPYQPTPSINPPRPRTLAAGYDKNTQTLRVRFRDGTPWEYYDVPERVWRNFKRVKSPGRAINRVLNNYPYARGDF